MKKIRIVTSAVCVLFVVIVICCINVHNKQQRDIENLNVCYELIKTTIESGFDKELANENKAIFKEVLEKGISETVFEKSMFYNHKLSFSEEQLWSCPEDRLDLNIAHSRDLILAMYLSCVLSTEPENLSNELAWMKDGIWQIDPTPEFLHLIATSYNPDKTDIDVLVNAFLEFSSTLEHPLDEYHTRAFIYTFINNYNAKHVDDKYVLKNEDEFIKENIEISKKIKKDDFETIWVGYGKVIRLMKQYILQ